jgi:putative ABC transport system permease protein
MVGVLGVSIGLALIMITVNGAFAKRLDDVRTHVGTDIWVRPAGSFGGGAFSFSSGGAGKGNGSGSVLSTPAPSDSSAASTQPALTDDDLQKLTSIAHVVSITRQITAVYTGATLTAAKITPPPGAQVNGGNAPQGFSPPIIVTGTDDPNSLSPLGVGGGNITLTSGRSFTKGDAGTDVAVIGQALATANNLSVGGTFTLDSTTADSTAAATTTTLTVIGVYTTGTSFGDNALALPIDTARAIFDRGNEIDQATVKADTVDDVNRVATDIKNTLGTEKADVTIALSTLDSISSSISDAKSSSQVGMIAALVASAAIILFSVGLVARQRIREIGILKAVGASGWNVVGQFAVETGFTALAAAFLGALATFPLAQTVANGLVANPSTPAVGPGGLVTVAGSGGAGGGLFFSVSGNATTSANGILGSVNVAVSPQVFLYAIAIAIALALIATIVPVWYVGRVRPAEVLRNE